MEDEKLIQEMFDLHVKQNEAYFKLSPLIYALISILVENKICTEEHVKEVSTYFSEQLSKDTKETLRKQM